MSKDFDSLFSDDIDSLFENDESFTIHTQKANILIIGTIILYRRFKRNIDSEQYNLIHVQSIDDAVVLLLQELFGIVVIDNDEESIDVVTISRVVRINHPLARIVVSSSRKGSKLVANIVNHGSVDAFLPHPSKIGFISNLVAEQIARHEISKMLTTFVSQPPKLSKASYLLLDPTLSFGDENEPVKFVGLMISYRSVPRFNKFFEDILAKDEILFSGYLSGIAMLGKELLTTKEPLKEINFGGVSVIFRFIDELQISIFMRNLTRHNYDGAENRITEIIDEIISEQAHELESMDIISKKGYAELIKISGQFVDEELVSETKEEEEQGVADISIMIYGSEMENSIKLKKYINKNYQNKAIIVEDGDKIFSYVHDYNCGVVLLDAIIPNNDSPIVFAEYCKEISPSIQIIFRVRDRRASKLMIQSLNSNLINYIIPYKAALKEIDIWLVKALQRVAEIKAKSTSGEGIDSSLDQATVARTMIRGNVESYVPDTIPELHGIFIFKEMNPIYQIFWDHHSTKIEFDDEMMAGLMASLDSIGGEMELGGIGGLELGGANINIKGKDDVRIAFFIKNIDPNTSVIVDKKFEAGAMKIFMIIDETTRELSDFETQARFDTSCNQIFSEFNDLFVE